MRMGNIFAFAVAYLIPKAGLNIIRGTNIANKPSGFTYKNNLKP